ncbi:hypothetical protein PoB_002655300 [Plakobranchus ocellatus]|uniref:Uncharacterized protein n=1 Tax=Plakobranchus ocellatus TaxID=259542 RepID=A0AAV4A009_9GAST|nr:hypothetical protein PoB_002655300 [Plakobranchus ocellatus]
MTLYLRLRQRQEPCTLAYCPLSNKYSVYLIVTAIETGPCKDFYILVGLYVVAKILWSALKEVWKLFETCDETFMEAEQWAGNVGNGWMCGLVTGRGM